MVDCMTPERLGNVNPWALSQTIPQHRGRPHPVSSRVRLLGAKEHLSCVRCFGLGSFDSHHSAAVPCHHFVIQTPASISGCSRVERNVSLEAQPLKYLEDIVRRRHSYLPRAHLRAEARNARRNRGGLPMQSPTCIQRSCWVLLHLRLGQCHSGNP